MTPQGCRTFEKSADWHNTARREDTALDQEGRRRKDNQMGVWGPCLHPDSSRPTEKVGGGEGGEKERKGGKGEIIQTGLYNSIVPFL